MKLEPAHSFFLPHRTWLLGKKNILSAYYYTHPRFFGNDRMNIKIRKTRKIIDKTINSRLNL